MNVNKSRCKLIEIICVLFSFFFGVEEINVENFGFVYFDKCNGNFSLL